MEKTTFAELRLLLGATGALLAAGNARDRPRGVVLIVVLQVAFNLMTPQVSVAAHAAGLLVGSLVAALLAAFQLPDHRQSPARSA